MTKKIGLFLALLLLLSSSLNTQAWHSVYVKSGNLYAELFTEPFETLYVQCENGDFYCITTQDELIVRITPEWLKRYLESKGHHLDDVMLMIHNHFGRPRISGPNLYFLQILKQYGFNGLFCVIDTASGKVICIRK